MHICIITKYLYDYWQLSICNKPCTDLFAGDKFSYCLVYLICLSFVYWILRETYIGSFLLQVSEKSGCGERKRKKGKEERTGKEQGDKEWFRNRVRKGEMMVNNEKKKK